MIYSNEQECARLTRSISAVPCHFPQFHYHHHNLGTHEGAKSGEIAPKQNKHSLSYLHEGFDAKEKQADVVAELEEAVLST